MSGFERLEQKIQQQHPGERYGDVSSFFHGSGIEISDFRKYSSGDAPRQINRKLSAKHDDLWVNSYHEDTDIGIHIFLDVNANWTGGSYVSHRHIVREWLADYMLFTKKHHIQSTYVWYVEQDSTMQTMICRSDHDWIRLFMRIEQHVQQASKTGIYTSSMEDFLQLQLSKTRKHVYILFSDFLDQRAGVKDSLAVLDHRHSVLQVILQVPDFV